MSIRAMTGTLVHLSSCCRPRRNGQDMDMATVGTVEGAREVAATTGTPLVLYDGTCGLCARSVRWILRHERDHALRFAPLQGETARALKARFPNIPESIDTIVYVDGDRAHLRSK